MKKILVPIAAILGFLGLATFTLFFIMSPQSFALPSGAGLTADIAANFFGNNNAPPPADQPAVDGNTAAAPTPAPSPEPTPTTTPTSSPTPEAIPAPITATQPQTNSATPAQPTPSPADEANNIVVPELPVASATITVSPSAPGAPPALSQNIQTTTASPGGRSLPLDETNFADLTDWAATWGIMDTTTAGYLQLSSGVNSFGGAAYLKSGTGWADYSMRAIIDPVAGKTFGLMADFADASNYVVCEYTVTGADTATMQLSQYAKGYKIALTTAAPVAWSGYGTDVDAGISVNRAYGTCSLGNTTITNEGVGPGRVAMNAPGGGSIGFSINDPSPDTARIVVKRVSVVAN